MNSLEIKEIARTKRLVIKTSLDESQFLDYADRNFRALRYGRQKKESSNECLDFYRAISLFGKVRKIPFFIFWLLVKRRRLLALNRVRDFMSGKIQLKKEWLDDIEAILGRLSKGFSYDRFEKEKHRLFSRYLERDVIEKTVLKIAKDSCLISEFKNEALEFIQRRGITTWRELRRHNRRLGRLRPLALRWLLEDLQEKGQISIKVFPSGTFLESRLFR